MTSPRDPVARSALLGAAAALAGLNAAVFALEVVVGARDATALDRLVEAWALVPRDWLRSLGEAPNAHWLTPVSAMFLHADAVHLLGNLLCLLVFGRRVEAWLGPLRFVGLYAASGLAAAGAHVASAPESITATLGASGAVSGVLGALGVAWARGGRAAAPGAAGLLLAGLWLATTAWVQLGAGDHGIAGWGHAGGLLAGAGLATLATPPSLPASSPERVR